jgi:hypothetical protein
MSKPFFTFLQRQNRDYFIHHLAAWIFLLNVFTAAAVAAPPDRAPIPQEVLDKLIPKKQAAPLHFLPGALNRHLEETLSLLDQLDNPASPAGSESNRWMFLSGKLHSIALLRRDIAGMFSDLRPKLFSRPTNDQLRSWNDLQRKTEKRFDEIVDLLDKFLKNRNAAALEKLKAELRVVVQKGTGESSTQGLPQPLHKSDRSFVTRALETLLRRFICRLSRRDP